MTRTMSGFMPPQARWMRGEVADSGLATTLLHSTYDVQREKRETLFKLYQMDDVENSILRACG